MEIISSERRRRRRISITAGWAAEGSEACGSKNDGKIVLEEGEHMEYLHSLLVFALFEDVMLSCCETAGYVRFALFTSGYGYSPPSATLAWDNFHFFMRKFNTFKIVSLFSYLPLKVFLPLNKFKTFCNNALWRYLCKRLFEWKEFVPLRDWLLERIGCLKGFL